MTAVISNPEDNILFFTQVKIQEIYFLTLKSLPTDLCIYKTLCKFFIVSVAKIYNNLFMTYSLSGIEMTASHHCE